MADPVLLAPRASELAGSAEALARNLDELSRQLAMATEPLVPGAAPFIYQLTVFVLAVKHPTWWELIVGAVGAAALGFVALRAVGGVDELKSRVRAG